MKEVEFSKQVEDTFKLFGWRFSHFRGVRIQRKDGSIYYQTPIQGDGVGFPDYVAVKGNRLLFAEIKGDNGRLSPDQKIWLETLGGTSAEVYVWKPKDFDELMGILRPAESEC